MAGGCLAATDVTYVSAVMDMKVLPCPTPKDKNVYYWASVIPTGLCTSLLRRIYMFIQLISCKQEQEFDPREKKREFTLQCPIDDAFEPTGVPSSGIRSSLPGNKSSWPVTLVCCHGMKLIFMLP
jgi:hypothetical protein